MWEMIRGYLTFTRKERYGVLFLLVLIAVLFIMPYFFHRVPGDPLPGVYEKMKTDIRNFESGSSGNRGFAGDSGRNDPSASKSFIKYSGHSALSRPATLFYFDPNLLDAEGWERLGLSQRLAQTILHYTTKGGRFRKAEDLMKLYGLHPDEYQRLRPYVRIPPILEKEPPLKVNAVKDFRPWSKKFQDTDINEADSAVWCGLPGIGGRLASRIIHFREKLGGFYDVDQVAETFGLPDSTFQQIKPYLKPGARSPVQLDLNHADQKNLESHPYIRWQIAKAIVAYRDRHAGFSSVDELLQLAQMDSAKFEKLKPYLVVNR